MGMTPFYQGARPAPSVRFDARSPGLRSANIGLLYTRFYDQFQADWTVNDEAKRTWVGRFELGSAGDAGALARTSQRLSALATALGGHVRTFRTDWHFATGLGNDHPVENGLSFHHTLGVPYLAASGVKGMLRGWVECWMDLDEAERKARIARWFGSVSDEAGTGSAGNLVFFDAVPTQPLALGPDVMTPHMGGWYASGDQIRRPADLATRAPADWHSPVPVPFLVVRQGTFQFAVAPRLVGDAAADALARQDCAAAMEQLNEALQWMGAGAKTAAGYGRMLSEATLEQAKAARAQAALAQSGIKLGQETWEGATFTWDPGRRALNVTSSTGRTAKSDGAEAEALVSAGVSKEDAARMQKKGKKLKGTAFVEAVGNRVKVVRIEVPVTA